MFILVYSSAISADQKRKDFLIKMSSYTHYSAMKVATTVNYITIIVEKAIHDVAVE